MKMYDSPQSLSRYLNVPLECGCGRTHFAPILAVEIGAGALDSLPVHVERLGSRKPYILCDAITWEVAGRRCESLLRASGVGAQSRVLRHTAFDEATLGEIAAHMPDGCDLMIGCGTGSITDMLRFSSFKLRLPCVTVATGAPMDGFAASIGVLNLDGLKTTLPAHASSVIIGDTDILATAPRRMSAAGFGDLAGKITCLNDWRLANIVTGEHRCENISSLVEAYVGEVLANASGLRENAPDALEKLMSALVLSGVAISLYGDSRPASGSEHHFSHYLETIGEQRGKDFAMHGEQVAVGSVLMLTLAHRFAERPVDFDRARWLAAGYSESDWCGLMHRTYGPAADEVIALEKRCRKNAPDARLRRIDAIEKNHDRICAMFRSLPGPEELARTLELAGCPSAPAQIGLDRQTLFNALISAKEMRGRYTLLQFLWDLGCLEDMAAELAEETYAGGVM